MTRFKAKPAPAAGIDLSAIEDEKEYRVSLSRAIQVGRAWVRPGAQPLLKGKVIKENADAVTEYADA